MQAKLQRYFLEIAYNGAAYHGWQYQPNAITVQEILDKALHTLFRCEIPTVGCGRTDTGVHAKQLFVHVDLPSSPKLSADLSSNRVVHQLNALLPKDIAAIALYPVKSDAHARFDALRRSYEYHIHFNKDPFKQGFSWQLRDVPDLNAMNEAAAVLKEYVDFSCFSKSNTQVFTNNCKIAFAAWRGSERDGFVFDITADRFLRNMVRAIVGTLLEIGKGRKPIAYIREVIESKNRSLAGVSVPAEGLYLTEVCYPKELFAGVAPENSINTISEI